MADRSRRALLGTLGAVSGVALSGCGAPRLGDSATASQATLSPDATYGYTHVQPTGNRVIEAGGSPVDADPVDVSFDGIPAWLVALPASAGSLWTVVTREGSVRTVRVRDGEARTVGDQSALPAGTPPLVRRADGAASVVRPPAGASTLSHPVVTDDGTLFVGAGGDLILDHDGGRTRFETGTPRDARLVRVDARRYATVGRATDRYRHGALGDDTEGGSLVVVDVARRRLVTDRSVGPPAVIEGLSPLVADVDGDGGPELVVTTATSDGGARIEVFEPDGARVARGPPIGAGGWRHQLCVAQFAPDGRPEIAVVRKPHVDHELEFYRVDGDRLRVTATLPGFSTHTYGSRNVDGAVAADLDGDGRVELLAPNTRRDLLRVVSRTGNGLGTGRRLALGGTLQTNLAGVGTDGGLAVGAATRDRLRVWQG